jgi:hypothetical protein
MLVKLTAADLTKCDMFTNPVRIFELFKADEKISKLIEASPVRAEKGGISR